MARQAIDSQQAQPTPAQLEQADALCRIASSVTPTLGEAVNLRELARSLERALQQARRWPDPEHANRLAAAWVHVDGLLRAQVRSRRLSEEGAATCAICSGVLEAQRGPGPRPEFHRQCRDLSHDLRRVQGALRTIWSTAGDASVDRTALRRWLIGELFPLLNILTAQERNRRRPRPIRVRIEEAIRRLSRTRAGREVLAELGLTLTVTHPSDMKEAAYESD